MTQMKKLALFGFLLSGALFGCENTPAPDTYTLATRAEQHCDAMKRDGQLSSWAAVSECYERDVHSIYTQAHYPNPDLVDLLFVKYRTIHALMDAGRISVSEGLERKKHVLDDINAVIAERMAPRFEA